MKLKNPYLTGSTFTESTLDEALELAWNGRQQAPSSRVVSLMDVMKKLEALEKRIHSLERREAEREEIQRQ